MFARTLVRIREKIRKRLYVMTLHAKEEMDSEGLGIYDVESVIPSGGIIERQRNHVTAEWKYLIRGETLAGYKAVVVAKLGPTGKLVVNTVYLE